MRVFAAVDDHSRRCVALAFDIALPAERVTRILDEAKGKLAEAEA